jgi:hypothetical protein
MSGALLPVYERRTKLTTPSISQSSELYDLPTYLDIDVSISMLRLGHHLRPNTYGGWPLANSGDIPVPNQAKDTEIAGHRVSEVFQQ